MRRTNGHPWSVFALVAFLAASAVSAAGTGNLDEFLGTWSGTSTCTNKQLTPACKDETVIYEVRRADKPNTAVLSADKVVDGKRLPMGDLEFAYSEKEGCWVSEIGTSSGHSLWCLKVEGSNLTGGLRHQPDNEQVRKVAARKTDPSR